MKTGEKNFLQLIREVGKQGRLYTYPVGLGIVLAGIASYTYLKPILFLKAAFLSLLIHFVAFAPNEYYDRNIDRKLKRKKLTGNIVTDEKVGFAVAWGSIIVSLLITPFLQVFTALSVLTVAATSILYSVPPIRLKGKAPFDGLSNGIGLFFIFCTGVGIAGGGLSDVISGAYWMAFIFTFYHGVPAIPDIIEDRKAGLRTMPMLVGKKGVLILSQFAALTALIMENFSSLTSKILLVLFFAPMYLRTMINNEEKLSKIVIIGIVPLTLYLAVYVYTRGVA